MDPRTLSASAIESFENCPAGYQANIIERVPDIDNDAAKKGSCAHRVLERWVGQGWYLKEDIGFDDMVAILDDEFYNYFSTPEHYDEIRSMLERWFVRQDWTGRTVLSTEAKETFEIPTSRGPLPVTYIWDRCDDLSGDGSEIEVVDYKSYFSPLKPEELKHKIQPRIYACAANVRFPKAKEIWVTYDLLRYEPISMRFRREQNVETWKYLQRVAERIYQSDGTEERLNINCRYCPRRWTCETFLANANGGGVFSIQSLEDAIDHYAKLDAIDKVVGQDKSDMRDYILEELESRGIYEASTDNYALSLGRKKNRSAPKDKVVRIVGPDLFAKFATLGIGKIDEMIKSGALTDDQVADLKALITTSYGAPYLKVKAKTDLDK